MKNSSVYNILRSEQNFVNWYILFNDDTNNMKY